MRRIFFLFCILILAGCARTTVVLLPNDDGKVGKAVVTPSHGESVVLAQPEQAVSMNDKRSASADGARIRSAEGPTLAAFPKAASSFLIYFDNNSDVPLASSNGLISKAAEEFKTRRIPQIMVIGHTDRTGEERFNDQLSAERAQAVGKRLERYGIPRESIKIQAFGFKDPYVATQSGVSEPRNRRVEIYIW